MAYELSATEIGLIIRPNLDDKGAWDGTITTGLACDPEGGLSDLDLAHLVHLATLMATFLVWVEEHDDVYEEVESLRNHMMGFDDEDEDEEPATTKEGNVIKINKWTKTYGSA